MHVRERFNAKPMTADGSFQLRGMVMGGFLAKTAGAITVTDGDGVVLVNAIPVSAGAYTPIPIMFESPQPKAIQLSGGASGTLLV